MARLNPIPFLQEVRQEVSKVTWPTRKEVWITTVAVLIMVTLASIFFMVADQAMEFAALLVQLDMAAPILNEVVFDLHLAHRAHASERVDHERNQSAIAQSDHR